MVWGVGFFVVGRGVGPEPRHRQTIKARVAFLGGIPAAFYSPTE